MSTQRSVDPAAVRYARAHADMTQAELAEAARVNPQTISRIERGESQPQIRTRLRIARALGVTEDQILRAPSDMEQPRTTLAGVEGPGPAPGE